MQNTTKHSRITQRTLFYWILRRHRLLQLGLLGIILISLFFRVFPLEMQKRIINEAIHLRDEQLLFLYCGLYMGAVILASSTKYAINVIQAIIGQKILVEIRTELYHHILQLPLQFYRKMQPGTVISAMTSELNAIGFFLGGAIAIPLTSVLSFLVFLGFMYTLSPMLALISVTIYPFELIVIPLLQKRYNRINKKRIQTTRAMSNVVNEAISGIHEIHSNSSYAVEENRLKAFVITLYGHLKNLQIVKYGIKFANNFFQSIGPFILFLIGGYLAIHGQFTLGALVAFLSAYEKVYDPWKEMLEYYQTFQDARVRYHQIMTIFDQEIENLQLPEGRDIHRLSGEIQLKNTGFAVNSGVKLLENINMEIHPNEQIALVGFSGSGKSTLALLIAQLYNNSSGSITFDQYDISSLTKADISRNITMIAQHPFIFTGTIRDNLLYSALAAGEQDQPLPDREQLIAAIHDVGLADDVLRFGFNSVVPLDKVNALKQKLLIMRQIINGELRQEFLKVVEPYDVNSFLRYSTLRDNIIFGDSLSGQYTLEKLPANKEFETLLNTFDLKRKLLNLGYAIAKNTVEILRDFSDDEFFFQGSPMEPEEVDTFSKMLENSPYGPSQKKTDQDRLLNLALRYIPGKHNITAMEVGLDELILKTRHYFLKEVVQFDLTACQLATEALQAQGVIQQLPYFEEERDFIAYCPSAYLYSHSLRDNILFGAMKQDLRDNQDLLELAQNAFQREGLLDEVLDIGLDFEVGNRGDRLSGGQKQKLAIARAFLKHSNILIMDEATSSLDNASQAKIQHLVENRFRGSKTIIAVIHRLDMTPSYDRIFVLKAGSIVEQGTYDELIANQGPFYELTQSK